ncbi:MAG: restriction endonuclease [Bacilli bacterium]|nr:restriction endonuclease [Bacilli bacterium]
MIMEEKTVWGMHLPAYLESMLFAQKPEIACGWKEIGDVSGIKTIEGIKAAYVRAYPEDVEGRMRINAGQLNRFANEMVVGDYVVVPSKTEHMILIGEVSGEYRFEDGLPEMKHRRYVKWIKKLPRTVFSQGALYESGSFLTIFKIKNYSDEFLKAIGAEYDESKVAESVIESEDVTVAATAEEIEQSTKDYILKELARQFKGYDLQSVVRDLLVAMGYNAKEGPKGADGGIDLIAYKDEFPPRIVVQVKSYEQQSVGINDIKNLAATLKDGDVGIFVTLGEYAKPAKKYLEETPKIRALTGYDFVGLILKYYDSMPVAFKNRIPLKMVFIPIAIEE